jgi:3-oxoacyl-[acyl-carrier protein] reductase
MQLHGKAAIVTGGGTGIGRACALSLARQGCNVVVNYSRSRQEAEETAAEIESLGVKAQVFEADVSRDEAARAMAAACVTSFGRLDILINSAGYTKFIPHNSLDEIELEDWDRIFAVNVRGPFQMARAVKSSMLESGGGIIVNISSIAAYLGSGSSIPYCASKAALNNLTIALARALAPKIRVVGVAPGFVTGRWLEKGLGRTYERTKRSFEESLPLGQVCTPESVADAVMGLVMGSDLVTGQTLVCDGGMMIAKWNASLRASDAS